MKKIGWIGMLLLIMALVVPAAAEEGATPHVHNVRSWVPAGTGHSGVCADCGETVTGSHSYGNWTTGNTSQHQHTCTLCGAVENANHNWNGGEITLWPYCTWEGQRTYTCRSCGRKKVETIPKLAHIYDNDCDIDCNRCGTLRRTKHQYEKQWESDEKEHWYTCTICGDKIDLDVHFPGPWTVDKEAGEFEDGQRHVACMICQRVLQTEVIPATGCLHGNEQLRDEEAPTCTTEGYTGNWRCPRCGEIVIPGELIPVHPHDTVLENQKQASCTEEGYTGDEICRGCQGVIVEGQIIEKLPHETATENQKEASCTEEGYTGDEVCQVCRGVITEGHAIEKLPHDAVLKNEKKASCTEEGYTGDRICSLCETVVEQGQPIPAKGHRYENGVCPDCQGIDPDYTEPTQPGGDPEPDTEKMSPAVIVCIVAMGVAFGGMAVVFFLMLKKK